MIPNTHRNRATVRWSLVRFVTNGTSCAGDGGFMARRENTGYRAADGVGGGCNMSSRAQRRICTTRRTTQILRFAQDDTALRLVNSLRLIHELPVQVGTLPPRRHQLAVRAALDDAAAV